MPETIDLILTKFTEQVITISSLFMLLVLAIFIAYWFYNRKQLKKLTHQIPASVVKNYLDSIIENSNSLKSSLFRGGGLELGEGIPSVVPTGELPTGNVSINDNGAELNKKNAEIALLRGQVGDKSNTIDDMQKQIAELEARPISDGAGQDNSEQLAQMEGTIGQLQQELASTKEALANVPTEAAPSGDMDEITKERDELKERLMEYEIIEEDLANLKRLQQENEQLKNSLAAAQAGGAPPAAEPEAAPAAEEPVPASGPTPEEIAAEMLSEDIDNSGADAFDSMMGEETAAPEEAAPVAEAPEEPEVEAAPEEPEVEAAPVVEEEEKLDIPKDEGEQKSAEELLSEFEKMLG